VRIWTVAQNFLHQVSFMTPDFFPVSCVQFQAAISPDASNIVCGSSNAKAYVWQVAFLTFNQLLYSLVLWLQ
jgi:hypothetical protein